MGFSVQTDYPVAFDSLDCTSPKGAAVDAFRNIRWNHLVAQHFGGRQIFASDWGTSSGNVVLDWLRLGHRAIGLEGCPLPKETKREAWALIPDNLFTADISRPFQILWEGEPVRLQVMSSWDCFEHIPEERVPTLMDNIVKHMADDGLVLLNIPDVDAIEDWHVNLKPREWWDETFARYGFRISQAGLDIMRRERVRSEFSTCFAYQKAV